MYACCHLAFLATLQAVKNAQSRHQPVVEGEDGAMKGEGGGGRGEGGGVRGEGNSEDTMSLSSEMEDMSTAHLVFRTEEDIVEGK